MVPCNGDISIPFVVPYLLFHNDSNQPPNPFTGKRDNLIRFWIHVSFICIGMLIAIVNFLVQWFKPLPYGKLSKGEAKCNIPVRAAHIAAHLIPGFIIFTTSYFTGLHFDSPVNASMYVLFSVHYISRGVITPLISRHSQTKVTAWIPVQILLTNAFFHYVNAEFIGSVEYCRGYFYDPRYVIGIILFLTGFAINRISDVQVIFLRKSCKDKDYLIPRGFLYYFISCPNYFGEGLQWFGWAILTWSLAGLVWWIFTESVFLPRARHNHNWYKKHFLAYPTIRKAVIPFTRSSSTYN